MRKIISVTVVTILLILLFLPYLCSVPPIKQILIAKFELKTGANIKVDTIRLSWFGPQQIKGITISDEMLDGMIEEVVLKTPFWKINDQPYPLVVTNGNFHVRNKDSTSGSIEKIHAIIVGTTVDASGITTSNNKSGSFSLQGMLASRDHFDLTFFADQMPTDPIDCIMGAKGDLNAMLGSSFNIKGSAVNSANQGMVNLQLSSPVAMAIGQATFTPTSVTLTTPFRATAPLPPSILKKLAHKGLILKDPVSIYLSNNSVVPLPFSLDKAVVRNGTVDLRKVLVPKPSGFNALATFLKTPKLADPNQIEICLTPIDFSLKDGHLKLGRMDALINRSTHLCAWGKINLPTEGLNMILGVPSDTLAKTLLLSDAASDFVLQVPVSGTLNDPKFDTATAAAQLATSVATDQVQNVGGNLGAIGGLVGKTVNRIVQPEATPPQKYPLHCP